MDYIWYDLKSLKNGQVAEINITVGANAKLMTYNNFTQYRFGLPYRILVVTY